MIQGFLFAAVMFVFVRIWATFDKRFAALLRFGAVPPRRHDDHGLNMFKHQAEKRAQRDATTALTRCREEERITSMYPVDNDGRSLPAGWHKLQYDYWFRPRTRRAENRFRETIKLADQMGVALAKRKLDDFKPKPSRLDQPYIAPSPTPTQGIRPGMTRPGLPRR